MQKNSSHCAIAFAIRDAVPEARHIAVDLQTIRWTNPKRGVRYRFLTPAVAQHSVIIPFDQGDAENCKPVTFRMKPAFITRSGAKRNHTPDPEQLRGTGLKVAQEQPHLPLNRASGEAALRDVMGEDAAVIAERDAALDRAMVAKPSGVKRKRVPRAKVSATRPDGSIPVTLGGKLPPVSVLSRREFGLRALRR